MKNKLSFKVLFILIVNIGCTTYNTPFEKRCYINKEKEILEKVSNEIIVQNRDYINSRKKWECNQPLFLNIYQEKEKTNGFKYYSAYFSESTLDKEDLPNYLWKKQGVYIVVYLDSSEKLSKSEIPKNLFKNYDDDCSRYESSWLILICNDTYKTKVIDIGLVHHLAVKQFQDFSCNIENDINGEIKIEDAIVDTVLMEKLMKLNE